MSTDDNHTHASLKNIRRFSSGNTGQAEQDTVSVEEPLQVCISQQNRPPFTLQITMRTPGNDEELATGFLFAEGIIKKANDIVRCEQLREEATPENTMNVVLADHVEVNTDELQRFFTTTSACGVCGKTAMQQLELKHVPDLPANSPVIDSATLCKLPERLRRHQQQFEQSGGVHSAALFNANGELKLLREDVGRHNAMDKLSGALLKENDLDISQHLVLVSGRTSFELVQKALMADIPFLAAIGAPTSLAIELATRHGMTLAGFLKKDSFNIYSSSNRIQT